MLRILLDAHVSARVIAGGLRGDGHDVKALAEDPALAALPDADVLALAARERRILVTHDVKDFVPLLRAAAEAGERHAGGILVHGMAHHEFGRVLAGLRRLFSYRRRAEDWVDLAIVLSPSTAR